MSESDSSEARDRSAAAAFAEAFDLNNDPFAELEATMASVEVDPFVPYIEDELFPKDIKSETRRNYRSVFGDWREHMEREGRHPACPNAEHVKRFCEWQLDPDGADNAVRTVKGKLYKLTEAYRYWQESASFPHPTEYNPFALGRRKVKWPDIDDKPYRRITEEELREMVAGGDEPPKSGAHQLPVQARIASERRQQHQTQRYCDRERRYTKALPRTGFRGPPCGPGKRHLHSAGEGARAEQVGTGANAPTRR